MASFDHENHEYDGPPGPVGVPLSAVFATICGPYEPTRAQRVSVHRAVRVLAAHGLIDTYSRRACRERHKVAEWNRDTETESFGCCGYPHITTAAIGRPRTDDENEALRQKQMQAMAMLRRLG